MTLNFYTLSVIYLVYSFLGWVAETVVATIRGGRFANRGAAAGPFCFIYGTTGVLLAVSFGDLRTEPVYLFFACMMAATVMEWITAKLLERLHRRKWWDYSGKKFNLNGYVCLQYSLLWGVLGTASVLWLNGLLLRLCQVIPSWLLHPLVWAAVIVAALDQIGSAVLVQQYAARHPVLEQLNQRLGERSDTLRRSVCLWAASAKKENDMAKDHPTGQSGLYQAFLQLKTPEQCYRFLQDVCSYSELSAMEQRYNIAEMLVDKRIYTEIMDKTGASSAIISRVSRVLSADDSVLRGLLEAEKSAGKTQK